MDENVEAKFLTQLAAKEELAHLRDLRQVSWEEHTHIYRWLTASFLGINGAACLAIFSSEQVYTNYKIISCSIYLVGISFALAVAVVGQRAVQRSIPALQSMIGYWIAVENDGLRDDEMESKLSIGLKNSSKIGLWSRLFGWISALAFVLGSIMAGLGLTQPTTPVHQEARVE
jgi:hypothetical protein